jgi:cobalt-zinc-cadmium efflux system membrane fusion protein
MKKILLNGIAIFAAISIVGGAVAIGRPDWLSGASKNAAGAADDGHGHDGHDHGDGEGEGHACTEHGVPEQFCTLCDPGLKEKLDLCSEHGGIPEDICTLCNSKAESKFGIVMCPAGHGLPRSFCTSCDDSDVSKADDGWCAAHNKPEKLCDACLTDVSNADQAKCRQPLPLVRFNGKDLAKKVGIGLTEARQSKCSHTMTANAEIAYDANRYADITPRVAGFLKTVVADLGEKVRKGDVLAIVDSPEISSAKAQYLNAQAQVTLAQVTYDRSKPLARAGTIPGKTELETLTDLTRAKAVLLEAKQRLKNYGFEDAALEAIVKTEDTDSKLNIVAPIDGIVVERHAVNGEYVEPNTQIFAVTDISTMWLWINVYQADIANVKIGQKVVYRPTIDGSDEVPGTLNWIGAEVDPKTRTVRARASLENPQGKLRANQFGTVRILVEDEHDAIIIPRQSVQTNEGADVVFLPQGEPGVFRPQRILTKRTDSPNEIEVVWGLKPGESIVSDGSFWLKTEIMKGAIGAGCAH